MFGLTKKQDTMVAAGLGVVALYFFYTNVLAMSLGQAPDGTLEGFYPIVDIAIAVVIALMAWRLLVLVRAPLGRPATGVDGSRRWWSRPRRIGGLALRGYLDVFVPAAILLTMPGLLGAGWPTLIRTDIGLVLAVIAGLRVADGAVRAWRWRSGRDASNVGVGSDASPAAVAR